MCGGVTKPLGLCLHRGVRKPWEILASFPQSYEMIMRYLLQRLIVHLRSQDQEPHDRTQISPLIVRQGAGLGWGSSLPWPGCPELHGPLPSYIRVWWSIPESGVGSAGGFSC